MEPSGNKVLILNYDSGGNKVYSLEPDSTKRFSLSEDGRIIELKGYNDIKLEMPDIDFPDDNSREVALETDDDSLFAQLQERDDLSIMSHSIVPEFNDDSLTNDMEHANFDIESDALNGDTQGLDRDHINEEEEDEADDVMVMHMDIREPLSKLRLNLEQRLGVSLHDYDFMLQETSKLESHKNLVDQCVSGEGLVQVNVQIRTDTKVINIVDVLKPAEEYGVSTYDNFQASECDANTSSGSNDEETPQSPVMNGKKNQAIKRWTIDSQFKSEQERLNIPSNPYDWSSVHVKHWLQWAVRQFSLTQIKLSDWLMTGAELCSLTLQDFQKKVPNDPNDIFWTHLELLKQCKLVAVLQADASDSENSPSISKKYRNGKSPRLLGGVPTNLMDSSAFGSGSGSSGSRSGNNGQIQLWQFLLELLTDKTKRNVIQWLGSDGEFKLINPEFVAHLWGFRKNKPTMNYEKLSRALRYYYDGDMISKVPGKRFVYKFVCDLKQLLGYDASELAMLIESCSRPQVKKSN